jgi:hypothetical protein
MIVTPNRALEWRNALERGEVVDLHRMSTLQLLDIVIAGRESVEAAILAQETEDDQLRKQFGPG